MPILSVTFSIRFGNLIGHRLFSSASLGKLKILTFSLQVAQPEIRYYTFYSLISVSTIILTFNKYHFDAKQIILIIIA